MSTKFFVNEPHIKRENDQDRREKLLILTDEFTKYVSTNHIDHNSLRQSSKENRISPNSSHSRELYQRRSNRDQKSSPNN